MKVIWLDTETTGTNPKTHGIIQISGMVEIKGVCKQTFNWKCNIFPSDKFEVEALQKNNTSIDEIEKYPDPHTIFKLFKEMLESYVDKFNSKEKFIFAGYNAQFDMDMMREWFNKNGEKYFGSYFWFPALDVMYIAMDNLKLIRHKLPNFQLGTVARHVGLSIPENLHDGLADIKLTKMLYDTVTEGAGKFL